MAIPAHEDKAESRSTPTPEAPPAPAEKKPGRDKHLYQLDLVRMVTFGAVILDHVIMGIATPTNAVAGAVELVSRYSRYSFFFLTGFVLAYQYRKRELRPLDFWRRRFKVIGIPYVTWTLFYWFYSRYRGGGSAAVKDAFNSPDHLVVSAKSLVYDLLTGNAWYHLYFLVVSMQIYLIFPLLLVVLKKTWGYHRYLLVVSFAVHMTLLYFMVRPQGEWSKVGVTGEIWSHLVMLVLPYQFFVLAGCVAAMHYEAMHEFARRWRMAVVSIGVVVIAATLGYFFYKVHVGEDMFRATNVFMPHNAFAYVAVIAVLYSVGSIWKERRRPGSIPDAILRTAADRSFGIYLAHGVALNELRPLVVKHLSIPAGWLSLLCFIATVAITVFIVETLRRSPFSLMTTGRSMVAADDQSPMRSVAVGAGAMVVGLILRGGFGVLAGDIIAVTGALLIACAGYVYWRQRTSKNVEAELVTAGADR